MAHYFPRNTWMQTHDKYSLALLLEGSLVFQHWKSRMVKDNVAEYTVIFIKEAQDKNQSFGRKMQASPVLFFILSVIFPNLKQASGPGWKPRPRSSSRELLTWHCYSTWILILAVIILRIQKRHLDMSSIACMTDSNVACPQMPLVHLMEIGPVLVQPS